MRKKEALDLHGNVVRDFHISIQRLNKVKISLY